ncbi:MAG: hypothetical protein KGZ71_07110 [Desulfobulbaceae bacterium]|nr:hypothetical protein [Candidatus Kapabacteria bacterium]MBS4000234.1 hypothetical protein [Desulfobulbaceae bacterium]
MVLLAKIQIVLIFLSYAFNFAHDLIPHDHLQDSGTISTKFIDDVDHDSHFHFGLFDHEHFSQTHNTQFRSPICLKIGTDCTIELPCPANHTYIEIDYQTKFLSYLALVFALSNSDGTLNIADRAPPKA